MEGKLGLIIAVNTYIKKERSQINNLTLDFKKLAEEYAKPGAGRRKEIETREEINKVESRKTRE